MSCSEDKFNENYQQNEVRNKYHHYYGTADFLFNKSTNHPKLAQFLQGNSVSLAMQKSGDTPTDIAINTDRVRVMSNDDVISYTFEVIEESENFEVRNLVIYHEVGNEEELYAYLFDYNLDENGSFELNDVSEFENTTFSSCGSGNTQQFVEVTNCIPYNCVPGGSFTPDQDCVEHNGVSYNCHSYILHFLCSTPGQGNTGGSSTGGSWDSGDGEGSNYTGGAGSGGNFGDGSSTSGGGVLTQPLGTKAQLSSILDLTRADLMSLDAEQADALLSFLYRNLDGFDVAQNAVDFALELLEIMMENPDVEIDFEDRIITKNEFTENDCLNSVYNQLNMSDIASGFLSNFEGHNPVAHLLFSVGVDSTYPNANAVTYEPDNFVIEIMFNPNKLERPSTDVARTFMHEIIHAEIYRKLLSLAQQGEIPWTENFIQSLRNDFPGLQDYYTRWWLNTNGQSPTSTQHQLMAQHYRNTISNFLIQFNPSLSQIQADALAWVGLMGNGQINVTTGLPVNPTVAWDNVPQQQRLDILNTILNFRNNNSNC